MDLPVTAPLGICKNCAKEYSLDQEAHQTIGRGECRVWATDTHEAKGVSFLWDNWKNALAKLKVA